MESGVYPTAPSRGIFLREGKGKCYAPTHLLGQKPRVGYTKGEGYNGGGSQNFLLKNTMKIPHEGGGYNLGGGA